MTVVFTASDVSTYRDRLTSLFHAANKKLRLRDKSKSMESDAFVPSISSRSKSTTYVGRISTAAEAELQRSRPANSAAATAELAVNVSRYPAYHFDSNRNAVSLIADNCKPSSMRRVARSCESLNSVRTCLPADSSSSGCSLPLVYRSLNS